MKSYYTPLSIGFADRKDAKRFKILMYKPQSEGGNALNRQKLYIVQDETKKWRVVRHMHEYELDDPMLGNAKRVAPYRKHLEKQTARCKPWLKKARRTK